MQHVSRPQRVDLTQQCVSSIRAYILGSAFPSGGRLPSIQEWAEMLGVSVVVVREAFRVLEALGLVEIQHGRGIFMRDPKESNFLGYLAFQHSLDQFTLEEVIEARAMLEFAVLETCISRADAAAIAKLEELMVELRADPPLAGQDSPVHKRFHQAMLEVSGDRLLASIGTPLLNTFWALGNTGQMELDEELRRIDMVACHQAYVDAIKARDFSRTRELVDQHLFGLCSRYGIFPYQGKPVSSSSDRIKSLPDVP